MWGQRDGWFRELWCFSRCRAGARNGFASCQALSVCLHRCSVPRRVFQDTKVTRMHSLYVIKDKKSRVLEILFFSCWQAESQGPVEITLCKGMESHLLHAECANLKVKQ